MATLDYRTTCELNRPVTIKHLDGMCFSQDVQANRIVVNVVRGGVNENLSGSVSANIIRADGSTVVQSGSISGNVASVVMPSSAYAVPGAIAVFVKHTASGVTSTLAAVTGYVYKSTTDTIVDPGTVVPNINELLAMIDECEDAAADARAAAAAAPVIDDTAGAGDTSKVWSASKTAGEVSGLSSTVNGLSGTVNGLSGKVNAMIDDTSTAADKVWSASKASGEVSALKNEINEITGKLEIVSNLFDIGNISASSSGWTYSNSTTRVRTKENETIHIEKGTIIGLASYSSARFYLAWEYDSSGTTAYGTKGWNQQDVVAPETGDYVILITAVPETTVSDKQTLIDLLFIQTENGRLPRIEKKVDDNTRKLFTIDEYNGFLHVDNEKFEIGSLSITTNGWSDQTNSKRVCTNRSTPIHLKKGVVVGLTDYSNYRFCLGWLYNGTYGTKVWTQCEFVTPYEADYVFIVAYVNENSASALTDKDDLLKLLYFKKLKTDGIGLNSQMIVPSAPRIIAHRGDLTNAPENSVPAFTLAGQAHVWGIETDIWETSDNHFVCIHNETVDATTDGTGKVTEKTLEQVEALTIDTGANIEQYPNLKIPTIDQFISVCKRYGAVAVTEIKKVTSYADMLGHFADAGMLGSVLFLVWYETDVNSLRNAGYNGPIAMIHNSSFSSSDVLNDYKSVNLWADAARARISASVVKEAHLANIPVVSYAAATKAEAIADLENGVDIVSTNGVFTLDDYWQGGSY